MTGRAVPPGRAALPRAAAVFEAWYRRQARLVLAERVAAYAWQTGLQPKKLRIGAARTRWGSCSSKGTLSFTWRLVMAPQQVVDYVVVHELCHLQVKNHSRDFWARVKAILPDYKQQVGWLKGQRAWIAIRLIRISQERAWN
jgi:predicted metal-dependent hydrolase